MAKRRDMYNRLAELRQSKVPIRTCKFLKGFSVTFIPQIEIREKKGGKDGAVLKVVSGIACSARTQSVAEPITHVAHVEVKTNLSLAEELDQCLGPALKQCLGKIKEQYDAEQKRRDELEKKRQDQLQPPAPDAEEMEVKNA